MENATKALLIAAAVLIVILVIAIAMRIYRASSGAAGDATDAAKQVSNLTAQGTQKANQEFTQIMQDLN